MSALPRYRNIRQQVLDGARWGTGEAHLEPPEVPQWIVETGDHDIAGTMAEALCTILTDHLGNENERNAKDHVRWCDLMIELCEHGEDLPIRKALELLDLQRSLLTDHCIADAQRMVDNA